MKQTAEKLFNAYVNNEPLEKGVLEFDSEEEAYAVQDEVLKMKEENGESHKGYKISLTSQETQDMFKTDHPLFGQMTDVTVRQSGDTLSLSDFNEPLVELELVFLVDEDVNASDSVEEVMEKCRVAPGLEVPDGRYEDWFPKTTHYEVVGDGAVNGAIVYGEPEKYTYEDLADLDAVLYLNGEEVASGPSSEVLGHPVNPVLWLAEALENRGEKLTSGLFVSSGTFVLPLELEAGEYKATFGKVGDVTMSIVE